LCALPPATADVPPQVQRSEPIAARMHEPLSALPVCAGFRL